MSKVVRGGAAALFILILGGCTMFSKGHTHVEYAQTNPKLVMTVAAKAGDYALYVNDDPIPRVVQTLKKGEQLGFEKNDEGRIRAVAGTYSTILARNAVKAKWTPLAKQ